MKAYTQLTTEMELIPSDMKWASSLSGELNNAATYFSPFANVSQGNKDNGRFRCDVESD